MTILQSQRARERWARFNNAIDIVREAVRLLGLHRNLQLSVRGFYVLVNVTTYLKLGTAQYKKLRDAGRYVATDEDAFNKFIDDWKQRNEVQLRVRSL